MKIIKLALLASILFCINHRSVIAQTNQDSTRYSIESNDGNEYIGTILSQDSIKVNLKTEKLGTISINRKDIIKIKTITDLKSKNGAYWLENLQATRYFVSGNGYGLKKDEAYYQNTWILFSHFNVGVTDNFSIGTGLIPLFLFGGSSVPVWITPRFSIPLKKDKINIGAGALIGTVLGEDGVSYGMLYGVSTFGSRDKNLSIGVGYGFSDGEWAKRPLISLSSMIRTGPRGYFITENYMFSEGDELLILLSIGGRRIIKKIGLDYGLLIPLDQHMNSLIAIPWLGLNIPLGK